ncbi:MAG: 2Fe-2S iron-sulfur cluster-binding protein [Candidatus Neptunochlamydia sp.]|nr:2Fe-2S iron-sulfur cluster-binding protein [Candidatus Neptunochlamydia sp.]
MAKLVLNDDEVELEDGSELKDPCEEAGVSFACREGICGTCVIEVKEGKENLSEMTQEELDFLGETKDERLACQCKIKQGKVEIDY